MIFLIEMFLFIYFWFGQTRIIRGKRIILKYKFYSNGIEIQKLCSPYTIEDESRSKQKFKFLREKFKKRLLHNILVKPTTDPVTSCHKIVEPTPDSSALHTLWMTPNH